MEREWIAEESVVVAADPLRVYETVADLRRMGRWSPECFAVWVFGRSGRRAAPGTAFIGFNRIRWRVWFTTGKVTAAAPGEVFAFRVSSLGIPVAVWGYRMENIGEGRTRLTEYWEDLRREGRRAAFVSLLGRVFTGVPAERRAAHNRQGMRTTLERIKAAVENR